MQKYRRLPLALALALVAGLAGCKYDATAALSDATAVLAAAPQLDTSTGRQVALSREMTAALLRKTPRSRDTRLEAKLQAMLDRLVESNPVGEFDSYTVYLVVDPAPNAFTPGGGAIFVTEGMIGVARTEAMMAMILAHELAHVERGHVATRQRDNAVLTGIATLADRVVADRAPGAAAPALARALDLVEQAARSGHGRAQEREADRLGFDYYVEAGWRPVAAAEIFAELARLHGATSTVTQFFHGTHPQSADRARDVDGLAGALPRAARLAGVEQTDEWRRVTRRYRRG